MKDGGAAFPKTNYDLTCGHWEGRYEIRDQSEGMSLRAYFAGQAMVGFPAYIRGGLAGTIDNGLAKHVAENCVAIADALIEELSK